MADDLGYGWAQGLSDAFQGLGWGSMFGATGSNPAMGPSVLAGFLQQQNQPRVFAEQRRQHLGNIILQGLTDGTIDWSQGGPALEKLGYDTRNLPPELFGQGSSAMGAFNQQVANFYAGGGRPAPAGVQPSPLAPPAPPPTPEETARSWGAAQAPEAPATQPLPSAVMRTSKDAQGNTVEQKRETDGREYTITRNPAGDVISMSSQTPDIGVTAHFTPAEREQYAAAQEVMGSPRLTQADINRFIIQSGARGKVQAAMFAKGQQLLKEDLERRDLAVKQSKTMIEAAQQRMDEKGLQPRDEAVGEDKNGKTLYQTWLIDKYGNRQKFGIPHHKDEAIKVGVDMGQRTAEEQSIKEILGPEPAKFERSLRNRINTIARQEQLNKEGIIGGPGADLRTFWTNMLSPFLSDEEKATLANTKEYEMQGKKLTLDILSGKELGSGNGITENDRRFVEDMMAKSSYDINARQQILAVMKHYAKYELDYFTSKKQWVAAQRRAGKPMDLIEWTPPDFVPYTDQSPATLGQLPATREPPKADTSKPPIDYNEMKGRFQPAQPIQGR